LDVPQTSIPRPAPGSPRLERLVIAASSLITEVSLEGVLQRVVEIAAEVIGARYAAIGVLAPDGRLLESFTTHGIDAEQRALIGDLPRGHGILGLVIRSGKPIRLPDLTKHPDSYGFPPHHPPMQSFLGVPIVGKRGIFGNLYLTEKLGDEAFTDEDEHIAVLLAANDAETAWHRIRPSGRSPVMLGRLKALAAWRESEAQHKNIPRGRIMRDETLADVASHPPKHQADLTKVRGLSQAWKDNDIGKRLMKVLEKAEPLPASEMPDKPKRGAPLGKEGALVADLLKLLLKIRSREIDVAARLLTRSDEMEALAAGARKLPLLEGWRYEVFGRDALDLVEGKLAFAVKDGKLLMTHVDDVEAAEQPQAAE